MLSLQFRITSYNVCYTKLLRIEGLADGHAIMQIATDSGLVAIDTTTIANGSFTFTGEKSDPEMIYITFTKSAGTLNLFLENATFIVTGKIDSLKQATITGGPTQDIYRITSYNVCYTKLLRAKA